MRKKVDKISSEQPKLIAKLEEFIEKNKGSLLDKAAPAERSVMKQVRELLSQLKGSSVDAKLPKGFKLSNFTGESQKDLLNLMGLEADKGTNIGHLWKTVTTLGELANFDFGGSNFESQFKYLYGLVNEAAYKSIKKKNPRLAAKFKALKAEYSEFKNTFENKDVISLFEKNNTAYVKTYQDLLNPDKMRSLSKLLQRKNLQGRTSPKAERLLRQMKRDYAEKVFAKGSVDERVLNDLKDVIPGRDIMFQRLDSNLKKAAEGAKPEFIKTPVPKTLRPQKPKTAKEALKLKEDSVKEMRQKQSMSDFKKQLDGMTDENLFKKMSSVTEIKKLEAIVKNVPGGTEALNKLKSLKMEKMIGDGMVNSVTHQLQLGTFSNILRKGNNRDIVKHILGPQGYKDLTYLQNHTRELQKSGQKFFNSSGSSTSHKDWSVAVSIVAGIVNWDPWLSVKVLGGLSIAKRGARLMADKEFLKLTRDAIIAEETNNTQLLKYSWNKIIEKVKLSKEPLKEASKAAAIN